MSPHKASDGSVEGKKERTGRKRKRQTGAKARRQARDTEATRRQRIRQYYNGATHGSASAVQLFAMAMQVICALRREMLVSVSPGNLEYVWERLHVISNTCK